MKNYIFNLLIFCTVLFLTIGCQSPTNSVPWSDRIYHNINFYSIPERNIAHIVFIEDSIEIQKIYVDLKDFYRRVRESFSNSNVSYAEAGWFYDVLKDNLRINDCYPRSGSDPPIKAIYYPDRVLIKRCSENIFNIFYPVFGSHVVKYFLLEIRLDNDSFYSRAFERWEIQTKFR